LFSSNWAPGHKHYRSSLNSQSPGGRITPASNLPVTSAARIGEWFRAPRRLTKITTDQADRLTGDLEAAFGGGREWQLTQPEACHTVSITINVDYLADQLARQLARRLVNPLTSWRSGEPDRIGYQLTEFDRGQTARQPGGDRSKEIPAVKRRADRAPQISGSPALANIVDLIFGLIVVDAGQ
jgi:hypothetical protein